MPENSRDALRAWFLGPRAENAELVERLFGEALRDHIFWRRNYHPEDGFTIREVDKRTGGYDQAVSTLTQELLGLLSELKRGVPFFSGRYKGHMNYEQTIASQIGYVAAMLYNPNNVAIEGSPATTRLELEVGAQLAAMIGYDPATSWGHLTSGGTVANFEALWIARNVHYLPVAAWGAARELGVSLEVELPAGGTGRIDELGLWELLNIPIDSALALWDALRVAAPAADVQRAIDNHSLASVGYQDYGRRLSQVFDDVFPAAVVLVAATAHYSWEKIVRALGIGSSRIVYLPVDERFRMDPDALWSAVRDLARRRNPALACISVCGTTEESAVDRLDLVAEVRDRARRELGLAFHLHSDAAYGGYAAAVTRRADGTRRTEDEIRASAAVDWPPSGWVDAMAALARADSVTIDPHKLGYIPYPAGAFLLRDRRAREIVAIDPPYLLPTQGLRSEQDLFLGRFIFEGSKPGASAAAVWLSHKVLPLDERGYGYLIERTIAGAYQLHGALCDADLTPYRLVLLPEPDINIVCFVATHDMLDRLETLNRFNEGIYQRMSLTVPGATPEYIITRTRFQTPMYDGAVDPILARLGISVDEWKASGAAGLIVLRMTVMDPFTAAPPPAPDHVAGFIAALRRAADAAYATTRPDAG